MTYVVRTLALLLTLLPPFAGAGNLSDKDEMALFLDWFPGEYDNHEQVWQQKEDGLSGDQLLEHIHHRFVPVEAPALGEHVFFVLQTMDDDIDKVYRQRIYNFRWNEAEDAVELVIYRMADEARYRDAWKNPGLVKDISLDDVSTTPGCEVYWRHNGEFFDGTMKEQACHFYSRRSGKEIYITDTLRLTSNEIWIADKATDAQGNYIFGADTPHKNRKVQRFSGWMGVKKSSVDPEYQGDEMFFNGDISIHNEGGIVALVDDEGSPTGYSIQLARLTYQNTRTAILKLGIIEDATNKTLVYTWGEPDATRLGINLRWFQVGLTAVDE
tara:strand:- start:26833 stop:27813 length:981 start_codon:yes stop_codon:yes gene_type:complete